MAKISVLGSGAWGIALALSAHYRENNVIIWSAFKSEVDYLNSGREHEKLLPDIKIPKDILITDDINAVYGSDIVIIAVPSFAVRETAARIRELKCPIVVNVAKGIENKTHKRFSMVISEELPQAKVVVLSGPSHAEEVARRMPTTIVAASSNHDAALAVQAAMTGEFLRDYTCNDVLGVELGGALKNVIAVAAGVVDGLGNGDNTRAALITRGLAEICRLGIKMGAEEKTLMGLSGLGDLVVTCTSPHSRNHRFGELVGRGIPIDEALKTVGTVEGYHATAVVYEIAKDLKVEMPITEECYAVLYLHESPNGAIEKLMNRPSKNEQIMQNAD
ncbi:MAG: NAD(P)H-dependent glycerol-3-phosphate dehydrogenase [Oscillospiraceae bacterium]